MIKVYLSIHEVDEPITFIGENEIEINISWLSSAERKPFSRSARALIDEILAIGSSRGQPVLFNRSYERIAHAISINIQSFAKLDSADFNVALAEIVVACRNHPFVDYDVPRQVAFSACDSLHRVRFGAVEMRVIQAFVTHPEDLFHRFEYVWRSKDLSSIMARRSAARSFLSADDIEWSILRLMQNAGFYFDKGSLKKAKADLETWCENYLASMLHGHVISAPVATPFLFGTQADIWRRRQQEFEICCYPEMGEVYSLLSKANALVVSPLAGAINHQMDSKNVFHLYTDFNIPKFSAYSIPAPVSVWPNRPSSGWQRSYHALCAKIDKEIGRGGYDLFIASCGCYGLPICNYVATNHGIKTFYIGNAIHAFFGIRQSSTDGFMANRRNEKAWVSNDLAKFNGLESIDGGRYI